MKLKGKAIILNGAPNSGKDSAAGLISERTGCAHLEFKATLHNIAMAITGLSRDDYFFIYNDREKKETPQPEFLGMSPRNMLIWISEEVCKPKFGQDYFGIPAAQSIPLDIGGVFSDGGFPQEVKPLCDRLGAENVYIVQFTRQGTSFAGDSRGFLKLTDLPKGVKMIITQNDGALEEFVDEILQWVENY